MNKLMMAATLASAIGLSTIATAAPKTMQITSYATCGSEEEVYEFLTEQSETTLTKVFSGFNERWQNVVETFTSPEGRWFRLIKTASGVTCIISSGTMADFRGEPLVKGDPV